MCERQRVGCPHEYLMVWNRSLLRLRKKRPFRGGEKMHRVFGELPAARARRRLNNSSAQNDFPRSAPS